VIIGLDPIDSIVERETFAEQPSADRREGEMRPELAAAERLANAGRLTEAESLFAKAVAGANDPNAINEYGRFLYRLGRFAQAEAMFQRVIEMPLTTGIAWRIKALLNLASLARNSERLAVAEQLGNDALKLSEETGDVAAIARSYCDLAMTRLHQKTDLANSKDLADRALEIATKLDEPDLLSDAYRVLGLVYTSLRQFDKAEEMHRGCLRTAERSGSPDQRAIAHHNLGLALHRLGHFDRAEESKRPRITGRNESRDANPAQFEFGIKPGRVPSCAVEVQRAE
jgi:tetratricopeptide (TPR) repeat protein